MEIDDDDDDDAHATGDDDGTEEISIQIPDSAETGDELTFEVNGQIFSIPVPVGSQPGDVLTIKLATGNTNQDTNDGDENPNGDTMVRFKMITGNTIVLMGDRNDQSSSSSIPNYNRSGTDGTFSCIWPAARFMVRYMNDSEEFHSLIQTTTIRSVMELGSGSGLVGMAFADIASHFHSDRIQLVLTDVDDAIDQLKRNIETNHDIFKERIQISAVPLAWHSTPLSRTNSTIDYLIGSDLLYNISNVSRLASTIRRLVSKSTKILISVRWRKPIEERAFFLQLSDIIEWKMIHGSCPLDFREYGNPACHESNKYFSQTMIGVNGKPIPLFSIDETATEKMSDVEFEQYEACQTQVYLGQVYDKPIPESTIESKRQKII